MDSSKYVCSVMTAPLREDIYAQLCDQAERCTLSSISASCSYCGDPMPEKISAEEREGRGPGPREVKILKFSKSGLRRPEIKKVTVMGNQRVTAGGLIKRAKKRTTSKKPA
jgi:RNA-binding protein